jgi:hypothetical protein
MFKPVFDPSSASSEDLMMLAFEAKDGGPWRRLVGKETRRMWASFSDEQRRAIACDADDEITERSGSYV